MSRTPGSLIREPLVIALLLINAGLGAILLKRELAEPTAKTLPAYSLPAGHPDVSEGTFGKMPDAGASPYAEMSPELAEIAAHARATSGSGGGGDLALSGTVRISPAMKDGWPRGAAVFVIARPKGGGPTFAVRRYDGVAPPFRFDLTTEHRMIAATPVPEKLAISVRADQDGDAITRQPGDIEGGPSAAVGPRASVDVTIDRPSKPTP